MIDRDKLLARMRRRDCASKVPALPSLKDLAPPPSPSKTVACERCEATTHADDLECFYGNYYLCKLCAGIHRGLAAFGKVDRR